MSKLKMVTIKNKFNGFIRRIGEPEFNNMIDKADYVLTSLSDAGNDDVPDDNWTKNDIMSYLENKGIDFKSSEKKADLLAKC